MALAKLELFTQWIQIWNTADIMAKTHRQYFVFFSIALFAAMQLHFDVNQCCKLKLCLAFYARWYNGTLSYFIVILFCVLICIRIVFVKWYLRVVIYVMVVMYIIYLFIFPTWKGWEWMAIKWDSFCNSNHCHGPFLAYLFLTFCFFLPICCFTVIC